MSLSRDDRQLAGGLAERAREIGANPLDDVRDPPTLAPREKETLIRWTKDDDRARIHSDERGIVRRLLAHPATEVKTLHVLDGAVSPVTLPPEEWNGETIVGLDAHLPIGALQVGLRPRESNAHYEVVSDRVLSGAGEAAGEEAEGGDEPEREDEGGLQPGDVVVHGELGKRALVVGVDGEHVSLRPLDDLAPGPRKWVDGGATEIVAERIRMKGGSTVSATPGELHRAEHPPEEGDDR